MVDAALALVREGSIPSSHQIAERAGVTQRTLFNHFGDMESLVCEAFRQQSKRVLELAPRVDPGLPLTGRIDAYLDAQLVLLEETMHIRWAILTMPQPAPLLLDAVTAGRNFARKQLSTIFAPELAASDADASLVLDELEIAVDPIVHRLRRTIQGLSPDEARTHMADTLWALLGCRS